MSTKNKVNVSETVLLWMIGYNMNIFRGGLFYG